MASSERRCSRNSVPSLYKVRACCRRFSGVSQEDSIKPRASVVRMSDFSVAFIGVLFLTRDFSAASRHCEEERRSNPGW